MAYGYYWGGFPEYVAVAERRKRSARKLAELRRKGHDPKPVQIEGRAIAKTFWGKAWCDHLESHADFSNRLPRGRTYVRNGSVIDLQIAKGAVHALVSGTDIYKVRVEIQPLTAARWKAVRRECAGQIGTVVELLAGKFSSAVMEVLCHGQKGIFPMTREIATSCSCPDGAWLCKHLAAVLYGVGARLDHAPELLFTLRGVDGADLVDAAGRPGALLGSAAAGDAIRGEHLADIFGIEIEALAPSGPVHAGKRARAARNSLPRRRPTLGRGVGKRRRQARRTRPVR